MEESIPLGGSGDPKREFIVVVVFPASDEGNCITGQVIPVNGGLDGVI